MLPNLVSISRASSWAQDATGARQPTYSQPGVPVPCSVQPATQEDVPDHMRESGVLYHAVYFSFDPGVTTRDRLLWTDRGGRIITSQGPTRDEAGRGVLWKVVGEERPVK